MTREPEVVWLSVADFERALIDPDSPAYEVPELRVLHYPRSFYSPTQNTTYFSDYARLAPDLPRLAAHEYGHSPSGGSHRHAPFRDPERWFDVMGTFFRITDKYDLLNKSRAWRERNGFGGTGTYFAVRDLGAGMPDTFLRRLWYVLNPFLGDPNSLLDRAGNFTLWVANVCFALEAYRPIPQVPDWVPSNVGVPLSQFFTVVAAGHSLYHMMHPQTAVYMQRQDQADAAAAAVLKGASPPAS